MKTSFQTKAINSWMIMLIASLFTFLSFESNGQDPEDIIATWIGTDFSFDQFKGPDISAMIEGGRSLHIGGALTLNEDKVYQIKDPEGNVNGKGTWELNGKGSFITIDASGDQTIYEILELKKNKLVTKHQVELETPDGKIEGEITLSYKKQ